MSVNRSSYDRCSYQKKMQEVQGQFDYIIYPQMYQNNAKCRMEQGVFGGNDVSVVGNLIDLENELRGQNAVLSHCMDFSFDERKYPKKHLPTCKMANYERPFYPKPMYNQTCFRR